MEQKIPNYILERKQGTILSQRKKLFLRDFILDFHTDVTM